MHLDEARIQRLQDGELSAAEARAARAHLDRCERCRALWSEIEREQAEITARLGKLDVPAPAFTAAQIVALAERRTATSIRGARAPRAALDGRLAWAAGLMVALGIVGLGYAMPGSPLRAWVTTIGHWKETHAAPAAPPANLPGAAAPDTEVAGVSLDPGQQLLISFLRPQSRARLRIEWSDGPEVEVRAPHGAAIFTSGAEILQIDNRDSLAPFEIRIPRGAPHVEIQVRGERVYLEEAGRVTAGPPD